MESLSKTKRYFLRSAPFPALVFFKVWASPDREPGSLIFIACIMFIYSLMIIGIAKRWDKPGYFDWVTTGYFGIALISLFFWPDIAGEIFARYAVTGIFVCLFSAAFFPPIMGMEPFTYHYAKVSTPREHWENPVFININRIMTKVWAGIFALCIGISLYPSVITRAVIPISLILGFGLPFNLRFPNIYLKRLGLPSLAEQQRMSQATSESKPQEDTVTKLPRSARTAVSSRVKLFNAEKEETMKVLALNSSPRVTGQSKTEWMLDHLVQGMQDAGAQVELIALRKKKINYCIGCFSCWTKTPGKCIQKDDMTSEIFPKWIESDLVVYATPLYHFTMNAEMKAFVERTLPVLQPFFERKGGKTSHPIRHKLPDAVWLSVAGFPEVSIYDPLSSYLNFTYKKQLLAEIYRPAAESMLQPVYRAVLEKIATAVQQAGRELVESRTVSPETLAQITQPIDHPDSIAAIVNPFWKTCIAEGVTPKEFEKKGMIPHPDSIDSFMMIMKMGFNPEAAQDTRAVMQFKFSGQVRGACYFTIENGTIAVDKGTSKISDLTIETPFDLWMDILTKKADGQEMFMQQKYRVDGDLALLMRMSEFFGNQPSI